MFSIHEYTTDNKLLISITKSRGFKSIVGTHFNTYNTYACMDIAGNRDHMRPQWIPQSSKLFCILYHFRRIILFRKYIGMPIVLILYFMHRTHARYTFTGYYIIMKLEINSLIERFVLAFLATHPPPTTMKPVMTTQPHKSVAPTTSYFTETTYMMYPNW